MDMFEYVETALDESMNRLKTGQPYVRINLLSGNFIIVSLNEESECNCFLIGYYASSTPTIKELNRTSSVEDARIELADILGYLLGRYNETWDTRDADTVLHIVGG